MRQLTTGVALVVLLGFGGTMATTSARTNWDELIVSDGPRAAAERLALSQALRLLPRMPARVAVIDSEAASPEVKATLFRLDAFIVKRARWLRRSTKCSTARRGQGARFPYPRAGSGAMA
jgi:hypothetical protein